MSPISLIGLSLVLAATAYAVRVRLRDSVLRSACEQVFSEAFAPMGEVPQFKMAYSYAVPVFRICHKSKSLNDIAESTGANAAFVAGIQKVCNAYGSQDNPYQASRAIFFTWNESEEEKHTSNSLPPRGNREA